MASEDLAIDQNGRWTLGGVTNDASEFIKNLRINPITGRLLVDAHLTSTNTQIGDTIPGGTAGSVLFLDAGSTLSEDNSNFFYDVTNHRLGLGTTTPTKTLHIVGTFRLVDGTQGNGYVLTTDGSGNASWANLATNTTTVTQLVDNTTFTTNLAGDTNFTTELIANNTFITNLGGDTTFLTTLQTNVDLILPDQMGNAGKFLYTDGTNASWESVGGGAGTVSSFSFTNANGFTGVVTNPTTTPNLTVTTNQTGILTGNGTALSGLAFVQGDIFYGSGTNTIAKLAKDTNATRYLSNTGTSNNPAWAQVNVSNGVTGTLPVENGGTGVATLTAYAPLFGGTTSTGAVQSGTVGTAGQVLTSNGAGALPTFQTLTSSITYTNGDDVKDSADASAIQNIAHGLGVIPKKVRITAQYTTVNSTSINHSMTVYNGTTQSSTSSYGTANNRAQSNAFRIGAGTSTDYSQGIVTFDATNIIITWTKTGSPTGVYGLVWEAEA